MTQYVGLIGYPLKHSISPAFQQAALDYYGLDIRYEKWETELKDLPSLMARLRLPQNLGANVTVPYKQHVLQFVDTVDKLANVIGAVNTIVNRGGRLIGFNTDTHGFLRALCDDAEFDPAGRRVLVLGAGGVARAVSFTLLERGVSWLGIANRTQRKAEELVGSLINYCTGESLRAEVMMVPLQNMKFQRIAYECHLVVNCTTIGMRYSPEEGQSLLTVDAIARGVLIYDLVYNPSETPLLKIAKGVGAKTLGGLPMLVYQGAASFKIWVGKEAPVDIMFKAAEQALAKGDAQ